MPETYGTAAFKSSARDTPRRPVTNSSNGSAGPDAAIVAPKLYAAPGVATAVMQRHYPADSVMRSKSPRFRETGDASSRGATGGTRFYVPPGIAQGAGASTATNAVFRYRAPRFKDPTAAPPIPGRLDSDTPVTGFAQQLKGGTAAFKTTDRFKPDPRVGRPPVNATTDFYVPPGVGSSASGIRVPKFKRDGTQRFQQPLSAAYAADAHLPPGLAAEVAKRLSGGFGKGSSRWKDTKSTHDRGADFFTPRSIADDAKGGATAAFRASARFKDGDGAEAVSRQRSRSRSVTRDGDSAAAVAAEAVPEFYSPPGVAAAATERAGLASASFRSASPRFGRLKSETAQADFPPSDFDAALAAKACPASAQFRSKTPRDHHRSASRERDVDFFAPPSFVDEILKR